MRLQNNSSVVNIVENAGNHGFCHFRENNLSYEVEDRDYCVFKHGVKL